MRKILGSRRHALLISVLIVAFVVAAMVLPRITDIGIATTDAFPAMTAQGAEMTGIVPAAATPDELPFAMTAQEIFTTQAVGASLGADASGYEFAQAYGTSGQDASFAAAADYSASTATTNTEYVASETTSTTSTSAVGTSLNAVTNQLSGVSTGLNITWWVALTLITAAVIVRTRRIISYHVGWALVRLLRSCCSSISRIRSRASPVFRGHIFPASA